jgi:hypothetical protein
MDGFRDTIVRAAKCVNIEMLAITCLETEYLLDVCHAPSTVHTELC